MKEYAIFKNELQNIMNEKSKNIFNYIEENINNFFSSQFIYEYYNMVKDVNILEAERLVPKFIIAWMAHYCGDNVNRHFIIDSIDQNELKHPYEISLYYSIIAAMSYSNDLSERLNIAKSAIDVLPVDESSIYMANAKFTYAKILSCMRFREAAKLFKEAYRLFDSLGLIFPAIISLKNHLFEEYKLGEFDYVIKYSKQILLRAANFKGKVQHLWNMIYFPLGLCCYEMNKPNLAIQYLMRAKECIDSVNLFHLHGYLEIYLFRLYMQTRKTDEMVKLTIQANNDFENMHNDILDIMLCEFRIALKVFGHDQDIQVDVERLELEYMKPSSNHNFLLVEALIQLKIRGLSDVITMGEIEKTLEELRNYNGIPLLHRITVLLAELYEKEGETNKAIKYLEEAVVIYDKYQICVSFYLLSTKTFHLLKKINSNLYLTLLKSWASDWKDDCDNSSIFSSREKEILQLIASGKSNKEIGETLFIGIGTVKWHINHIFSKLNVKNRMHAVQKAKAIGEI